MANSSPESDEIRTRDLEQFAEFLHGIGDVFSTLAKWLDSNGIKEMPDGGMPTARRGARYLANFTSNVLTTYHDAQLEGRMPPLDSKIVVKGHAAEAVGRNLAAGGKKKRGTNGGTKKS